eukprot:TRINITY_DN64120_c0_g1_i1.p1 TRINITY_DN64120_c0_g1~~TRINITY_DN64120_c0_g1_i1.p1  ORF type:complete len:610 (-),score=93.03 TRINITY_DN64120_c0_g1_i1:118-1908(-)
MPPWQQRHSGQHHFSNRVFRIAVVAGGVATFANCQRHPSPNDLPVWPAVKTVDVAGVGTEQLALALTRDFILKATCNSSVELEAALERSRTLFLPRRLPATPSQQLVDDNVGCCLPALAVCVEKPQESVGLGTSEAYSLVVESVAGEDGEDVRGWRAILRAETQVGAYRGLETFGQLVARDVRRGVYGLVNAPLSLHDAPRFAHRGLLLDSVRHYFPVPWVLRTLEAMSLAKLNVLHWHLTDSEALPIATESQPRLTDASWSAREVYSAEDLEEVTAFAAARGIRVVAEVDVPGHSRSWSLVLPEIFPEDGCPTKWWSMDPSRPTTLKIVRGIIEDVARRFPDSLLHVGGDEIGVSVWGDVRFDCWADITDWAIKRGFKSFTDILGYFMSEVIATVEASGKRPIVWDEVWRQVRNLSSRVIVQVWEDPKFVKEVAAKGHDVIASPVGAWYLDDLNTSWEQMYTYEPWNGFPEEGLDRARVLGGEAALWAEKVDPSTLDAVVWPRAAAVAERLWSSSLEGTPLLDTPRRIPKAVKARLASFRCLLLERGVGASPLTGIGRSGLSGPSSCYGHKKLPIEQQGRGRRQKKRRRAIRDEL